MDDEQQPPDPADVPVPGLAGCDDPTRLLVLVREQHAAENAAARVTFLAAARWAEMHAADSITRGDWGTGIAVGAESAKPVAGAGCPLVAEFCVPEFAALIGRSTDSGRRYLGQAVEVRHRLPQLWAQVCAGTLPAWRAAQIADATMPLSTNAAAFVDAQVACVAAKIGGAQLGRLVGEAIARFDPEQAERDRRAAADGRSVNLRFGQTGGLGAPGDEGVVALDGVLGYADARDLDQALRAGAADLAALGSPESLGARRAQTLGDLARADLTLDLDHDHDHEGDSDPAAPDRPSRPGADQDPSDRLDRPGTSAKQVPTRQVVIHAHLSAEAVFGSETAGALARVEGHGWVSADQVAAWCAVPGTRIVVRPVVDTTGCIAVDAYEIPDRLRAQVVSTSPSCVFPWCVRNARRCDIDHVTAEAAGGPTCSCNLAPLCRYHHRLKTHTGWTYDTLDAGAYLWRSPHGHQLCRDHTGTTLLRTRCAHGRSSPPRAAESSDP